MCALALGACAGEGAPVKTISPGGDRSAHGLQTGSGERAAAVTELGIAASSGRIGTPEPFLVDRPFLLVVGDGQTGWPLFLASVLDPRG